MAASAGKDTVILAQAINLSSFFQNTDITREQTALDSTTYGKAAHTFIRGLANGTVSLSGLFDSAVDASDEELQAALSASARQVVTIGVEGVAIGKRVNLVSALHTQYRTSAPFDGIVTAAAEIQADEGIDGGMSLHALTADSATGNSASVDNGAATTNGGVAHIHATANTRDGATTLKVQHSVDDAIWVDLVTFASIPATTKTQERVVVAAGTTVNRYLRETHTLAGITGSITAVTAFARR